MPDPKRARPPSAWPWAPIAVALAIAFVAFIRLRVAGIPLERDEGEYAYAGQLILEGVPPYGLAYNMKFPGTYYAYSVILALFGHTPWGIHVGLLLVNAATIVLLFAVGRRLFGPFAGGVAAVSFAVLSLDRWVFGIFAHATHFVVLAAMAGLYVLLRAIEDRRPRTLFSSGALFGLAVLMKQHAIFFLPMAAGLIVWDGGGGPARSARDVAKQLGLFVAGTLMPLTAVIAVLFDQGVLARFWFWTFRYASAYVTEIPLAHAWSSLLSGFGFATTVNVGFWVIAAFGLVALWVEPWERPGRIVLTGLLVTSFLAICPGFYFRGHYFVLMLPAISLLAGVAVSSVRDRLARVASQAAAGALALAVLAAAAGTFVWAERASLFTMSPTQLSRDIYGSSPFIEAVTIANYIRERTGPGDRIAVLGSEPEIYFYAGRRAATGYIYTYALMEPQPYAKRMQDEMIREIESVHPTYLVFSWINDSWLAQKDSDQGIVTWGQHYVRQCYDPVGVADIISEDETRFAWDDEVRRYTAASANLVYTFKRKSDAPCKDGGQVAH